MHLNTHARFSDACRIAANLLNGTRVLTLQLHFSNLWALWPIDSNIWVINRQYTDPSPWLFSMKSMLHVDHHAIMSLHQV